LADVAERNALISLFNPQIEERESVTKTHYTNIPIPPGIQYTQIISRFLQDFARLLLDSLLGKTPVRLVDLVMVERRRMIRFGYANLRDF
jgi:hypothetical protein